jgi:hypothetical protein
VFRFDADFLTHARIKRSPPLFGAREAPGRQQQDQCTGNGKSLQDQHSLPLSLYDSNTWLDSSFHVT